MVSPTNEEYQLNQVMTMTLFNKVWKVLISAIKSYNKYLKEEANILFIEYVIFFTGKTQGNQLKIICTIFGYIQIKI